MKNVIIGILINNNREIIVMWYVVVPYTGGYQLTLTIIIIIIAECSSTVPIIIIMPPRGIDTPQRESTNMHAEGRVIGSVMPASLPTVHTSRFRVIPKDNR